MFFFPLINFAFLIILYVIHRPIFWITLAIETILYVGGMYWIYHTFANQLNQMYYTFTLTGIGFIVVLMAFVVAIFLNHHHQK